MESKVTNRDLRVLHTVLQPGKACLKVHRHLRDPRPAMRPHFNGICFCHILSNVERIKFRLGSKSPDGIRGGCASIPFARLCSILVYSIAYSCATMSEIPLQ